MKVVLIRPDIKKEPSLPIQLGIVATILSKAKIPITVFDLALSPYQRNDAIKEASTADIVFFICDYIGGVSPASDADALKRFFSTLSYKDNAVLIGHFPTLYPQFCFDEIGIDYIIPGDPEAVVTGFIERFTSGTDLAHGVWTKKNYCSIPENINRDIDSLPPIEISLLPFADYLPTLSSRGHLSYPLVTSRGCDFSCSFCLCKTGKGIRVKSIDTIIKEISYIFKKYNIKHFLIEDDLFTHSSERVFEFCNGLDKSGIKISWECINGCRPSTLDCDLIRRMARSGLRHIAIGIESMVERENIAYKNHIDTGKLADVIACCRLNKVNTTGYFIVSSDTNLKRIFKDLRGIRKLGLTLAHFSTFRRQSLSSVLPLSEKFYRYLYYVGYYLNPAKLYELYSQGFLKISKWKKISNKILRW